MEADDARMAVTDLHHKEADQVNLGTAHSMKGEHALRAHSNSTGREAHSALMGTA